MHDARTTTWMVLNTSPQRCRVSPGAAAVTRTSAGGPSSASMPALAPATACRSDPPWAAQKPPSRDWMPAFAPSTVCKRDPPWAAQSNVVKLAGLSARGLLDHAASSAGM